VKVIVLGCGPAGLMAAQAVLDAHNINFDGTLRLSIVSKKRKSELYGAQYLHAPIPSLTPPKSVAVSYTLHGHADDYRRKVYGPMFAGTVSPEDLPGEHQAWDIRATYDILWKAWEYAIQDSAVDPLALMNLETQADLVISSVPRSALCHEGHTFGFTEITAAGDAPGRGIRLPYTCPDNMVICNAEDSPAWYRMSRVFGHTTVEWPGDISKVPVTTAARVQKPTSHDCNCCPDVLRVGRYGRWEKGVLSHTAYFDAFKKVDEMLGVTGAAAEG
jgi:hypothetical protein